MLYYMYLIQLELTVAMVVCFGYLWEESRITKLIAYLILVELVIFKAYLTGDNDSGALDFMIYAYWRIILGKIGFYLLKRAKAK